jgi:hypothetical protein
VLLDIFVWGALGTEGKGLPAAEPASGFCELPSAYMRMRSRLDAADLVVSGASWGVNAPGHQNQVCDYGAETSLGGAIKDASRG